VKAQTRTVGITIERLTNYLKTFAFEFVEMVGKKIK
jgi:hypothetical protein